MSGTASFSSSRIIFFFTLFVAVPLSACDFGNSQQTPECYYEITETLAEVVDMRPHPDGHGHIAVILDFKASILALDDQELGALRGVSIDHEFLERNNIEMNNKYEVVVSELTKGDCDTKLTVAFNHAFE